MCRPHRVRTSTCAPTTRTVPHTQRCSPHDHLQLSRSSHQQLRPQRAARRRAPPTSARPPPPPRRQRRRCSPPRPPQVCCRRSRTWLPKRQPALPSRPPWSPRSSGHDPAHCGRHRAPHGRPCLGCRWASAAAAARTAARQRRRSRPHAAGRACRRACRCRASSSSCLRHDAPPSPSRIAAAFWSLHSAHQKTSPSPTVFLMRTFAPFTRLRFKSVGAAAAASTGGEAAASSESSLSYAGSYSSSSAPSPGRRFGACLPRGAASDA
mmetsp:Transcript_55592/g.145885  ORF Transcript_55592/g.145885 Transcript_55592/m.145885 type:complete len:266 (+) Transcript_55592:106-903(+)